MSDDSAVCSTCGNPQFACECEFSPEYLPPDGQERCPNCHGPQDRCVCAPSSGAELSLFVEPTDVVAPTIVVDGPVLSRIDQAILIKLLEHEFSTDCSTTATGAVTIPHVQKEAVADYFRQLGYSIGESTDSDAGDDTAGATDDTALYTPHSDGGDHATPTQSTPEGATDSEADHATATFEQARCPACERAFTDRDDIPTFCPACGTEL